MDRLLFANVNNEKKRRKKVKKSIDNINQENRKVGKKKIGIISSRTVVCGLVLRCFFGEDKMCQKKREREYVLYSLTFSFSFFFFVFFLLSTFLSFFSSLFFC